MSHGHQDPDTQRWEDDGGPPAPERATRVVVRGKTVDRMKIAVSTLDGTLEADWADDVSAEDLQQLWRIPGARGG